MNKTKTEQLYSLISSIRYQLSHGIHTMGMCNRCHKQPARGAGICKQCRVDELIELVGDNLATAFYLNTIIIIGTIAEMEDKLNDEDS